MQSQSAEEYFASDQEANWETGYWTQMIYSILMLMVSIFSVSYIVRAVVEEKSSKLVETLLVSIRPLALILGKILAVMACVFGGFAALALGVLLSFAGTSLLWPQLSIAGISGFFSGISLGWDTVPVLVVSLALGHLTFALVAGLSGAGCSSTQELDGAMSFSVLLIMAGYLAGIFISTLVRRRRILAGVRQSLPHSFGVLRPGAVCDGSHPFLAAGGFLADSDWGGGAVGAALR